MPQSAALAGTRRFPPPQDLLTCGQRWLAYLTPFLTAAERQPGGVSASAVLLLGWSIATNLIFHRRPTLDALGERLLDANRTIGQPRKITTIFGRKVTNHYHCKR